MNIPQSVIQAVSKKAESLFSRARGSHGWDHTQRVYALAVRIASQENADMNVVKLAALLHDIGRSYEDSEEGSFCHAEKGAEMSRDILEKLDVPEEMIRKTAACVRTHRFRGEEQPEGIEAEILFDADKLDSVGAVGIGRAFLFAGEVGACLHNSSVDLSKTKPYTKEDTAYREFMLKLRFVKERMLTREGKRIAEQRHKYMVEFFDRLEKETMGEL